MDPMRWGAAPRSTASLLSLGLSVGAKGPNGHATDFALGVGGGKLSFKGNLSELGPNARLTGIASSTADNLIAFADTLVKMTGQPEPALPPLLAGKFSFDGAIDVSQTAISAKDFKLALGQDTASGSLALTLKPALSVDGKLAASRLDLDGWLAAVAPRRRSGARRRPAGRRPVRLPRRRRRPGRACLRPSPPSSPSRSAR